MSTRNKIQAERVARTIFTLVAIAVLALVIIVVVIGVRMCGSVQSGLFSGGDEVAVVPDVAGMAEQDAISQLQNAGLAPKVIQRDFNETVPAGSVFDQNPDPKRKVGRGTVVNLYISMGKGRFTVPGLTGQDVTDATRELMEAGFTLGAIAKVYRADMPAGRVINQEPAAGRVFPASTSIDLTVADVEDLPEVSMPALVDLTLTAAESQLVAANLHLSDVDHVPDAEAGPGTVLEQNFPAGDAVELGAKVELQVAMDPQVAASRNKTINLHVPVPPGPDKQRVRIKVFDELGGDVYFDEELAPGDRVDKRVNVEGKATIFIFLNDLETPFRSEHIPYTGTEPAPGEEA